MTSYRPTSGRTCGAIWVTTSLSRRARGRSALRLTAAARGVARLSPSPAATAARSSDDRATDTAAGAARMTTAGPATRSDATSRASARCTSDQYALFRRCTAIGREHQRHSLLGSGATVSTRRCSSASGPASCAAGAAAPFAGRHASRARNRQLRRPHRHRGSPDRPRLHRLLGHPRRTRHREVLPPGLPPPGALRRLARQQDRPAQALEWARVGTDRDGLAFNGTPGAIVDAEVMLTAAAGAGHCSVPPAVTTQTVRSSPADDAAITYERVPGRGRRYPLVVAMIAPWSFNVSFSGAAQIQGTRG